MSYDGPKMKIYAVAPTFSAVRGLVLGPIVGRGAAVDGFCQFHPRRHAHCSEDDLVAGKRTFHIGLAC
jgi:hypothetical protein